MSSNIRTSSGAALARRKRYFAHDSIVHDDDVDGTNYNNSEFLLPPKEDPRRHRHTVAASHNAHSGAPNASIYDEYEASVAQSSTTSPQPHTATQHLRADDAGLKYPHHHSDPHPRRLSDIGYGDVGGSGADYDPYTRSDTASVREPSHRSGSLDARAAHSINSTSAVPIWAGSQSGAPSAPSAAIAKRGTQQESPSSADTSAVSIRHRRHNQHPPPRAAPVILTYPTAIELRRQVQKMVSNAAATYFTDVEREYSQVERLHRQHHHVTNQRELAASNGLQASLPMYVPPTCEIVLRTVFTVDAVTKAPILQRAAPMSLNDIPHALSTQLEVMCRQCINPLNLEARKRAREVLAASQGAESSSIALKQMYKKRNNSNSREGSTTSMLLDLSPEKPPPPGSEYKREFAVWVAVQGALVTPLQEGEILRGFPGEEQYWDFGQSGDWEENEDGRHVVLFHSFMVVDGADVSDEPVWERDSASPHRGPPPPSYTHPSLTIPSQDRFETPIENPNSQRNSAQISYAEIEEQVRKRQQESDIIASEREAEEMKARRATTSSAATTNTTPTAPAIPTLDLNTQAGKMLKGAESILKQLRQLYFIPAQEIVASSSPNSKKSNNNNTATTRASSPPPKVRLSQQGVLQGLLDFSILCQKAAASLHCDIQLSEQRIEGISTNTNAALQDFISRAQQEAQDKIRHSEEEAAKQKAIFDQRGTEIQEDDAFDTENDAIVALMNELATTKARLAEFEAETDDVLALKERLLEKERDMERDERLRKMRQRDSYTQYGDDDDELLLQPNTSHPPRTNSNTVRPIDEEEDVVLGVVNVEAFHDNNNKRLLLVDGDTQTDTILDYSDNNDATPPLQYSEVVPTDVVSKAVSNAAGYFQAEHLRDSSTSPTPRPELIDSVTMTSVPATTSFAVQVIDGLDDSEWHPKKDEVAVVGVAEVGVIEVQTEESWEDAVDMVYAQAALDLERQLEEDRLSPLSSRSPPQRRDITVTTPRGLPPLSPRGGSGGGKQSGVSPPRRPMTNTNITEEDFNSGNNNMDDGSGGGDDRRRKSHFNPPRHVGVEIPLLAEYKDQGTLTAIPPCMVSSSSNTNTKPLSTIAVQTQIRADVMDAVVWSAIQSGSVPPEILDVHHPRANRSGSPLPYHQHQRSSVSPPVADSLPSSSAPSSPVMVSVSAKTSASPSYNPQHRAPSFEEEQQHHNINNSGTGPRMFSEDMPESPFSIHRGSPYTHQQQHHYSTAQLDAAAAAAQPHSSPQPQLERRLLLGGGGVFDGYEGEDSHSGHVVPFADRIQAILDAEERAAEVGRSREYYLGEMVASKLSEAELQEIERQREKRRRLQLQTKERRAKSTERQADRRRKEREEAKREEDRRLMSIRLEYQRQLDEETERRRLAAESRGVSESTDVDNASSSLSSGDSTSEGDMPVISQGGEPSAQTTRIYLDGALGEEIYHTLHHNHHGHRSASAAHQPQQQSHPQAAGPFSHSRQRSPEAATSKRPQYRSQHQLVPPPPISTVRALVGEQKERVDYQQRQRDQYNNKGGNNNLWYGTPKSNSSTTPQSRDPVLLKNAIEGLFQGRQLSPPAASAQPRKSTN